MPATSPAARTVRTFADCLAAVRRRLPWLSDAQAEAIAERVWYDAHDAGYKAGEDWSPFLRAAGPDLPAYRAAVGAD